MPIFSKTVRAAPEISRQQQDTFFGEGVTKRGDPSNSQRIHWDLSGLTENCRGTKIELHSPPMND